MRKCIIITYLREALTARFILKGIPEPQFVRRAEIQTLTHSFFNFKPTRRGPKAGIKMMNEILPLNPLPKDVLDYLYRITIWVENKDYHTLSWEKGFKRISKITIIKHPKKTPYPQGLHKDTLNIPKSYSATDVLRQIRHALCHGAVTFNNKTKQIILKKSKNAKITGSFTLEGIKEFVNTFILPKEEI